MVTHFVIIILIPIDLIDDIEISINETCLNFNNLSHIETTMLSFHSVHHLQKGFPRNLLVDTQTNLNRKCVLLYLVLKKFLWQISYTEQYGVFLRFLFKILYPLCLVRSNLLFVIYWQQTKIQCVFYSWLLILSSIR